MIINYSDPTPLHHWHPTPAPTWPCIAPPRLRHHRQTAGRCSKFMSMVTHTCYSSCYLEKYIISTMSLTALYSASCADSSRRVSCTAWCRADHEWHNSYLLEQVSFQGAHVYKLQWIHKFALHIIHLYFLQSIKQQQLSQNTCNSENIEETNHMKYMKILYIMQRTSTLRGQPILKGNVKTTTKSKSSPIKIQFRMRYNTWSHLDYILQIRSWIRVTIIL
jgi:hypothetical protein